MTFTLHVALSLTRLYSSKSLQKQQTGRFEMKPKKLSCTDNRSSIFLIAMLFQVWHLQSIRSSESNTSNILSSVSLYIGHSLRLSFRKEIDVNRWEFREECVKETKHTYTALFDFPNIELVISILSKSKSNSLEYSTCDFLQ
jgi:hypothetical protein